jgi:hypothetical protein
MTTKRPTPAPVVAAPPQVVEAAPPTALHLEAVDEPDAVEDEDNAVF